MRMLFLGPSVLGDHLSDLAETRHWNLTSTHQLDEALVFLEKTDFQIVFFHGDEEALERNDVERLRQATAAPLVACLRDDAPANRARILKIGALNTVRVPFDVDEFHAVALSVMQHEVRRPRCEKLGTLSIGPLVLDLEKQTLGFDAAEVFLPGKQYQLVELLMLRRGTIATREMILNHLYDYADEPEAKIIDVMICKTRQKLALLGLGQDVIQTVWGMGYRLAMIEGEQSTMVA